MLTDGGRVPQTMKATPSMRNSTLVAKMAALMSLRCLKILTLPQPVAVKPEREDRETRRLIRKINMRLTLVLSLIYASALVDRVNLPSVCSQHPTPQPIIFGVLTALPLRLASLA